MANTNSLYYNSGGTANTQFGSVSYGGASGLDTSGSLTIETWVKMDGTAGNAQAFVRSNSRYLLDWQSPGLRFGVWIGGLFKGITSTVTVSLGSWTHLAATYNGANLITYFNGVAQGTTAQTGAIDTGANSLFVAQDSTSASYLAAIQDEVRIWNVARTAAEINNNKSVELVGNETGLVAYYKYNSSSGTVAADSAGTFTLSLFNTPTWSTDVPFTGIVASSISGYKSLLGVGQA